MTRFLVDRGQLMSSGLVLAADRRPSIPSSSDSSFVAQNNTTQSSRAYLGRGWGNLHLAPHPRPLKSCEILLTELYIKLLLDVTPVIFGTKNSTNN